MNLVLLSKDKNLVLSFWFSGLFILYVTALGRGSCTDCSPFLILPCLVNYLNIKDHRKSRQTFHATLSTWGIIFWSRNKCRVSFLLAIQISQACPWGMGWPRCAQGLSVVFLAITTLLSNPQLPSFILIPVPSMWGHTAGQGGSALLLHFLSCWDSVYSELMFGLAISSTNPVPLSLHSSWSQPLQENRNNIPRYVRWL